MQGELLDGVTGLKSARTEFVMLQAPDGQLSLEVIKYHQPVDTEGIRPGEPNAHGLRHIAFQVDDLDGMVKTLQQKGHDLVGGGQNYENVWKLCYEAMLKHKVVAVHGLRIKLNVYVAPKLLPPAIMRRISGNLQSAE